MSDLKIYEPKALFIGGHLDGQTLVINTCRLNDCIKIPKYNNDGTITVIETLYRLERVQCEGVSFYFMVEKSLSMIEVMVRFQEAYIKKPIVYGNFQYTGDKNENKRRIRKQQFKC